MVWTWLHLWGDVWSTLDDDHHGWEALVTIANVYHMQGEVMINMVGYEDPMVYYLWRNDVNICKFFWDSIMLRVE